MFYTMDTTLSPASGPIVSYAPLPFDFLFWKGTHTNHTAQTFAKTKVPINFFWIESSELHPRMSTRSRCYGVTAPQPRSVGASGREGMHSQRLRRKTTLRSVLGQEAAMQIRRKRSSGICIDTCRLCFDSCNSLYTQKLLLKPVFWSCLNKAGGQIFIVGHPKGIQETALWEAACMRRNVLYDSQLWYHCALVDSLTETARWFPMKLSLLDQNGTPICTWCMSQEYVFPCLGNMCFLWKPGLFGCVSVISSWTSLKDLHPPIQIW